MHTYLPTSARPSGRVSVAMTSYNGAVFLPEQLDSILRQTDLPDEMVICDDGSTDGTLALLDAFAASAPFPVSVIRNPVRLNFAQNFSKCMSLCNGDLIILTDSDDIWYPYRVEDTRAAFAADPELAFTYSDAPLIDENGKDLGRTIYSSVTVSSAEDHHRLAEGTSLLPVLMRWEVLFGCTMAFRASLRRLVLPVPKTWSYDIWIAILLSAISSSARLSRPVTQYRQHPRQLSGGIRQGTLRRHFANAHSWGQEKDLAEIEHYELAISAVELHPEFQKELYPLLHERIAFLRRRQQIHSGGVHGLILLLRSIFVGDYKKYSAGLRSILKDLTMALGLFGKDNGVRIA